jgi:hypothetical protein
MLPTAEASVDLSRVLDTVAAFLEGERRRYALAGALALHAYGFSRATQDLDLVVEREAQPALLAFMEGLGYETLHRSEGYSNHAHADPVLGRVDFIYVDAATARALFAGCTRTVALGRRAAPVPRAEHLAAMKVHAMKNDPARTLRDLADVQHLLAVPGVDRDEVRGYFERARSPARWRELERLT